MITETKETPYNFISLLKLILVLLKLFKIGCLLINLTFKPLTFFFIAMNTLTVIGAIISFAALFISALAFLQSRKLPNENKIFEEKIKAYLDLIKGVNEAANIISDCIDVYVTSSKKKEIIDELHEEIDNAIFAIEDLRNNSLILLPDEVVDKLDEFLKLFDNQEYLQTYSTSKKSFEHQMEIDGRFDKLVIVIRQDLAIDKLNNGLRKRISGSKVLKKLNNEI